MILFSRLAAALLVSAAAAVAHAETLPLMPVFSGSKVYTPLVFEAAEDGGFIVIGQREDDEADQPELRIARLSATGQRQWERAYGRESRAVSVARIRAVPGGGFLMLNDFLDEAGDLAASLQRLDTKGVRSWSYRFTTIAPSDVAVLPGGGFLVAGTGEDPTKGAVLQRFNATGGFQGEHRYRGRVADRADVATLVEGLPDGGAVIGGVADFDPKNPDVERRGDAWVARLNPEGGQMWRWFSGEPGSSERLAALDRQKDGRVLVAVAGDARESGGRGNRLIGLASDGTERWNKPLDDDKASFFVLDVAVSPAGGGVAVGFSASQTSDSFTATVLAVDADGKQRWRRDFVEPAYERAIGVRRIPQGYAVLLDPGATDTAGGAMILKLDETGKPLP